MMTKKLLFALALFAFFAFTTVMTNSSPKATISDDPKELSRAEFDSIIKVKIMDPISKQLEKNNPSIFMTKCQSHLEFISHDDKFENEGKQKTFNVLGTYSGSIIFVECAHRSTVCDFRINLSDLNPWARESYFDQWLQLEDFLKKKFKK